MESASAWLDGCYSGSSGLLTSTVACQGSVEVCCWVVAWVASRA
jgi:hypothetical protein